MSIGFENLLEGTPARIVREPVTARVVRSDDNGIWVVPLGGDTRHPIGPCRGPLRTPVDQIVILVWTQEVPWVFGGATPHELDTTDVHGIPDTALLETQAGAQAKAEAEAADALAAAIAEIATQVAAHNADTTGVHGIADTALLETQAGAQAKVTAAIDALIAGAPGTLDTLNEIAAALAEDDSDIAAIFADLATKETPAGAQAKADAAAAAAVADHEDTAGGLHGDTGLRRVVDTTDLVDLPDLVVIVRRVGAVVTVFTRETTAAAFAGGLDLITLPSGFRFDAHSTLTDVYDPTTGAPVTGATLLARSTGLIRLTAVSGARHYACITGLTSDAWPATLPGTPEGA